MNEDIRAEISRILDSINDENVLYMIKEDVAWYKGDKDILDELDDEQLADLEIGIKEADNNETVSWDDFKKEMGEWKKR